MNATRIGISIIWAFTPMALSAVGLLPLQRLKGFRRYAIVLNLIVAAVITTPDILTQVLTAVAFQACYEIAVLTSWLRHRHKA